MTVPMALMDFVPVLLFGAAWVILYRDLKNKLNLCSGILLPLGAGLVFLAGFLKATWKMQKALGVPAVELFNKMMFPTQSVGFLLMAVGMLALMYGKRKSARSLTMVWVMLTVDRQQGEEGRRASVHRGVRVLHDDGLSLQP